MATMLKPVEVENGSIVTKKKEWKYLITYKILTLIKNNMKHLEQHYQKLDETTQNVINSTGEITGKYNKLLWELILETIKDKELYKQFNGSSVYKNAQNTWLRIQNILSYKQDVCVSWQDCEFTTREINRKYFWLEEILWEL